MFIGSTNNSNISHPDEEKKKKKICIYVCMYVCIYHNKSSHFLGNFSEARTDSLLQILPISPALLDSGVPTTINLVRMTRPNQGNYQRVLRPHRKNLRLGLFLYLCLIAGLGELSYSLLLNVGQDSQRILHGVINDVLDLEFVLVISMRVR